jgi:quercetin dioxygenase-like cupin family protein
MSKLEAVQKDELREGAASPGITRQLAFEAEGVKVIRSRVEAGTIPGWHHHGDYDIYGFVMSGTANLEAGLGGKNTISVGPGGFFHVPAQTVHREINPSADEGGEVILFVHGSGPMVQNLEGPDEG